MNQRADPAAILDEARAVDIAAVFGYPGKSKPGRPRFVVELIQVGRRFRRVMVMRGARFEYPMANRWEKF
jgi:hypothetical protein